jgi:hypothetical protein
MHVASSFEFAMAAAMSENPTERLRGMAPAMLVWGRTKNWIGGACELGRPAQHVIRFFADATVAAGHPLRDAA